jgi:D-arabinose 1-dehydrogenase-like Zn-dependent alcohol dehydrogenase
LLCAGSVTYNALRRAGATPGDLVAVQGIGGLGHLEIQFANKFGYKVTAIGRGSKIESLAKKLGVDVYIDSKATNPAEELWRKSHYRDNAERQGNDRNDWPFGSKRQACPDRRILRSD